MHRRGPRGLFAIVLILALTLPAQAFATPSIADKKADAAQAAAELRKMQGELSSGIASYTKVSAKLAATRSEIDKNGKRLSVLEKRLGVIGGRLGQRADYMYRTSDGGLFDILFGATSLDQFLQRFDFLARVAADDASLVREAKANRAEARRLRTSLRKREAELVGLRDRSASERDKLASQLQAQRRYFSSLSAEVAAELAAQERANRPAPSSSPKGTGGPPPRSGNGLAVATVEGRTGSYYVMSGEPRQYRPLDGVSMTTQASTYSVAENGTRTSSGHPLDDSELTCAHLGLKFGTRIAITKGSRRIICVVTDRGPYSPPGRDLDLTLRAARLLGIDGVGNVRYEIVVAK